MPRAEARKIRFLLLRWFGKNKRPLPWRRTRDPYKIWISEMMLQQTQVKTVIPYYGRWLKNFPNVRRLAKAPLSRVLKSWEGLGYYRRAQNLHQTAKVIVKKHQGRFPRSAEELKTLPGIGCYTAGAIASIAFDQPEPVLDGNVKRVLSRIFAVKDPIDQKSGEKKLWRIAHSLATTPLTLPGDLNQALMELGALVCLPDNPKCAICPVNQICKAHQQKKEEAFPLRSRKESIEQLNTAAVVLRRDGKVLLQKQPLETRWGGLWTFPYWTLNNGKSEKKFLRSRMKQEWGLGVKDLQPLTEIEHGFTKYRVRLHVYTGMVQNGLQETGFKRKGEAPPRPYSHWFKLKNFLHLPLPRPHQKIAALLQNHA